MKKKLLDASVWKFLLVGVGNTLLSLVLMFLLEGLGYWSSTAIAYVAGAVMSFFLNRSFTFQSRAAFWPSVLKFAVNVAVCYLIAYSIAQPAAQWVLGWTALTRSGWSGWPRWGAWGSTLCSTTSASGSSPFGIRRERQIKKR